MEMLVSISGLFVYLEFSAASAKPEQLTASPYGNKMIEIQKISHECIK